jgi:mannose-6-phosphate isomerase-like protein (cupin superfamily)
MEKVNIAESFEKFQDTFSPKVVADLNGQQMMIVRCEGDKVPWHIHDNEDEMFFVVDGILEVFEKDKTITLNPGEFYVVERGIEHRVVPIGHVKLILFEPAGIAHTGKVESEITKKEFDRLEDL